METPRLTTDTLKLRLGVQEQSRTLPLVPNLQPTMNVLDGSLHVRPIVPPSATAGFDIPIGAASNVIISFHCRALGGALIEEWGFSSAQAPNIFWAFRIAPTTNPDPAVTNLAPNFDVGIEPCKSRLLFGLGASLVLGQLQPMWRQGGANPSQFRDYFVPPGYFFLIEQDSGASALAQVAFYMKWREYP